MIVASGGKKYVIELKRSAEGRRDRLVPLLSQAILQAQAAARNVSDSAIPVAVVASHHVPDSVASQLKLFALESCAERRYRCHGLGRVSSLSWVWLGAIQFRAINPFTTRSAGPE